MALKFEEIRSLQLGHSKKAFLAWVTDFNKSYLTTGWELRARICTVVLPFRPSFTSKIFSEIEEIEKMRLGTHLNSLEKATLK